jgi:dienelactone hydrolase
MILRQLLSKLRRWYFGLVSIGQRRRVDIADDPITRKRCEPPVIVSSWDDLLAGVKTERDWKQRKEILRQRYLELLRDDQKPSRPPLEPETHESVTVEGIYTRHLISYNVEPDERAHAYLAIPLNQAGRGAGIIALHGTIAHGKERTAGLRDEPGKAHLDHLARRGYVVIAPDHFVAGQRCGSGQEFDTRYLYLKHPEWSAVGKFTYENSIAVDVLQAREEVDPQRIGVLGHSLGGHGSYFLAAYDDRIKAAVCNCSAGTFRHNPKVEEWARNHWYIYFKHIREALLAGYLPPIDMHEIIALIAPRAFLDISGLNDGEGLTQRQRVLMHLKIMEAYELEQAPQNFAFYTHGQGHTFLYDARTLMYAWMDKHLKEPESLETRLVR